MWLENWGGKKPQILSHSAANYEVRQYAQCAGGSQRSILAALVELECPEEVLEVCSVGLTGHDAAVQEASVDAIGALVNTRQENTALSQLIALKNSGAEYIRVRVAYALKHFDQPEAKEALIELRQDTDHWVIGAAMETLL